MTAPLLYNATLRQIDAKAEYQHFGEAPAATVHCCICHEELGTVAYRLHVPGHEIGGVHYSAYGAEFCSEEHARQWLETKYNPLWAPLITDGIPTQETRDVWIHAFRQVGEYLADTERSGKWLVWLAAQNIDRYWQAIREAVELGGLGGEAKVSTAASSSVKRGRPYVVCVYTYDYDDKADVMRIREALRDLGIRRAIPYKADEDTHALRYGGDYTPRYRV